MDEKRLAELEKLAGLELEASQRAQFLVELQALEDLASHLPPLNSTLVTQSPVQQNPEKDYPACPLDEKTIRQNAPDMQDGLFRIPGIKEGHGSSTS